MVIKKGNHRPCIPNIGLHFGKSEETWEVMFTPSCRYNLDGPDQLDWNKLFGWSYGCHHKNSVRIAWRYDLEKDAIQLSIYQYKDGKRIVYNDSSLYVEVNKEVTITMFVDMFKDVPCLQVDGCLPLAGRTVARMYGEKVDRKWGYTLGLYFGGNQVAPHDIEVKMKRL